MSVWSIDARHVPRWILENRESGRWSQAGQDHHGDRIICISRDGIELELDSFVRTLPCGVSCYFLDGPTFPVADGGSAVKVAFLRALAAAGVDVVGVAADWGWERYAAYAESLRIPVIWVPPHRYFAEGTLEALMHQVGSRSFVADSLETMARLSGRCPGSLLLFDFSPKLLRDLDESADAIARARELLRRLDPSLTTLITRSTHDAASVAETAPGLRTVVIDGIGLPETSDRTVFDPEGAAVCIGNFHYQPNRDGLLRLLDDWPSNSRLRVVGNTPPAVLEATAGKAGVLLDGLAPTLVAAFEGASVGLVPLMAGGGSSVKTVDYAAHGLPVLSTTVGVRGLARELVECCHVVSDVAQMARFVEKFDPGSEEVAERARRAQSIVRNRYNMSTQIGQVIDGIRG